MPNPIKKSKIPYFFVVFFAVFIMVDISYIFISSKTYRGVVSKDAYEKGIDHNQILQLVDQQKKLGWKVEIEFTNLGNSKGILKVMAIDKDQRNLNSAKIHAIIRRPTQEGIDFEVDLKNVENGWFEAVIDFPKKGQWEFEIIIKNSSEILQVVKKYVIQ